MTLEKTENKKLIRILQIFTDIRNAILPFISSPSHSRSRAEIFSSCVSSVYGGAYLRNRYRDCLSFLRRRSLLTTYDLSAALARSTLIQSNARSLWTGLSRSLSLPSLPALPISFAHTLLDVRKRRFNCRA